LATEIAFVRGARKLPVQSSGGPLDGHPVATNKGIAMALVRLIAVALLFACAGLSSVADAQSFRASDATPAWLKKLPAIQTMKLLRTVPLPKTSCDFDTTSLPRRPVCKVDVDVSLATSMPSGAVVCTAEIKGVLTVPHTKKDVNVVWSIVPTITPPGHSFEFAPDHGVLITKDPHEQIRPKLGSGVAGIGGLGDDDVSLNVATKFFWRNKNRKPTGSIAPIEPIFYMPAVLWTRPNPSPTPTDPTITELCRAIDPKIVNDG
jgi:hypothetical protein